jgi:hypothetical protein
MSAKIESLLEKGANWLLGCLCIGVMTAVMSIATSASSAETGIMLIGLTILWKLP